MRRPSLPARRRDPAEDAAEPSAAPQPPELGSPPIDPTEHELLQRLADLDARLRDTQALAARAYEATLGWPRILDEIRSSADYERAYEPDPLVSVRISTYNQSQLLCERALASLRRQTYTHWEALVVGDACDDDTEQRIAALGDDRIRFWNLPFRGPYPEVAQARWYVAGIPPANAAIAAARGRWIAPLDHDDEWDDDHIEVLLQAAQSQHAELTYSRMRVIHEGTGDRSEFGVWPPVRGQFAFQAAIHHAGLARFLYDENCRLADEPGDWNLGRRMWAAGVRFSFLDRVTGTYHHVPKHEARTAEERLIEELRNWAAELQTGLDWWKERAEGFEAELERARRGDPPA